MNWQDIQATVTAWASRSDVATPIPYALQMAEDRIYNGSGATPGLRLLSMLNTTAAFASGASPDAKFLGVERMSVLSGGFNQTLSYLPPDQFAVFEGQSGQPAYYTVRSGIVIAAPLNGSTFNLQYYKRLATPTLSTDENAIMRDSPRIYVYGILAEIANWLQDSELAAMAETAFRDAMESARENDMLLRTSNGPITIRNAQGVRV